jgi:hypothetical protein
MMSLNYVREDGTYRPLTKEPPTFGKCAQDNRLQRAGILTAPRPMRRTTAEKHAYDGFRRVAHSGCRFLARLYEMTLDCAILPPKSDARR